MCDSAEKKSCEPLEIPTLIKEVDYCIQTLNQSWDCHYRTEYENVIKRGRYQILNIIKKIKAHEYCHRPALSTKEELKRNIFHAEVECEFEQTKIDHLRREWTKQQDNMARLQESLYKKCRLMSLHGSYCSTQGSALCAIVALMMERKDVVHIFLADADTYLKNFIKIADGCLFSFIKTYASDTPLEDAADYKFVLSLWISIAHISAVPDGRMYLLEYEEGQKALRSLTYVLPRIRHTTAERLVINLWKLLRNVSKEDKGKIFLQGSSEMPATLNHYILRKYHPEIHTYTLETLEQICQNIVSKEFLDQLMNLNGVQRLKELSGSMYPEVKHIPRKVLNNVSRAAEHFLEQEKAQEKTRGELTAARKIQSSCGKKSVATSRVQSEPSFNSVTTKQTIQMPPDVGPARVRMIQRFRPTSSGNLPGFQSKLQQTGISPICATPCTELFQKKSSFYQHGPSSHHGSAMLSARPLCPVHRPTRSTQRNYPFTPTSSSGKSVCISTENTQHKTMGKKFQSSSGSTKVLVSGYPTKFSTPSSSCNACRSSSRDQHTQKISEKLRSCGNKHSKPTSKGSNRPVCLLACNIPPTFIGAYSHSSSKNVSTVSFSAFQKRPQSSPAGSFRTMREESSCQVSFSDLLGNESIRLNSSRDTYPGKTKKIRPSSIPVSTSKPSSSSERERTPPEKSSRTSSCKKLKFFNQKSSSIPVRRKSRDSSCSSNELKASSPVSRESEQRTTISFPAALHKPNTSDCERKVSGFKRKFSPLDPLCKFKTHKKHHHRSRSGSSRNSSTSSKRDVDEVHTNTSARFVLEERPNTAASIVPGGVYYYDEQNADSNSDVSTISDREEGTSYTNDYVSDRRLVLWKPEERALAYLDQHDRRFSQQARTMRIISRIQNKTHKRHQKVVTRIRLPTINFNTFNPEF